MLALHLLAAAEAYDAVLVRMTEKQHQRSTEAAARRQADLQVRPLVTALPHRCCKERRHVGGFPPLYPCSQAHSTAETSTTVKTELGLKKNQKLWSSGF